MVYTYICQYILIYVPYIHKLEVHRRFFTNNLKGNGCLGKHAMKVARLVNDEENDCRFVVHREEH